MRSQRAGEAYEDAKLAFENATSTDSPIEEWKVDLEELRSNKSHEETQLAASKEALRDLGAQNVVHKRALDGLDERVERLENEIESADNALIKIAHERERALRKKNEALEFVNDAKKQKELEDRDAEQFAKHVEEFIREASSICARVPVEFNAKVLDKKIEELREQIRRAEREAGGTPQEIRRAAIASKGAWLSQKKQLAHLEKLKTELRISIAERSARWLRFRSEIVARARIQFKYLLMERAFIGKLNFDHVNKELDLLVEPNARNQSERGGRETQTLSGGEKSYSTICLLLALWDAMGSPVRCLDEFDVFMDSVNRDISMKMMIAAARRSVGRQFILITPQSMSSVTNESASDVKVILMREPERGQTALPFGS